LKEHIIPVGKRALNLT